MTLTALGDKAAALTSVTASGAWEVATVGSRPEAEALGHLVLSSDLATTDDNLLQRVLRSGARSVTLSPKKVSELVTHRLMVEDPDVFVDALLSAEDPQRTAVLVASEEALVAKVAEAITEFTAAKAAREKREKEAAAARAAGRAVAAPADDDDSEEPYDPVNVLAALDRLLKSVSPENESAAVVLRILLKVDKIKTREIVQRHLNASLVRDCEVAALVLEQAHWRVTRLWPKWLDSWPAEEFADDSRSETALLALVDTMWQRAAVDVNTLDEEELMPGAISVARLLDYCNAQLRSRVVDIVALDDVPMSDDELAAHKHRTAVADVFVRAGVIPRLALDTKRAELLTLALGEDLVEEEPESELAEWVLKEVTSLLDSDLAEDALASLIAAGSGETWLSEPDEARLRVRLLEHPELDVATVPPVSADAVAASRADLTGPAFIDLEQRWLKGTDAPLADVLAVLRPDLPTASSSLLSAVATWRAKLAPAEQFSLLESFISSEAAAVQSARLLSAVGLNEVDESSVASLLVDRYRRCTNNEGRRAVLQITQMANFSTPSARKRILLEVIAPMLSLNTSAADIALEYAVRLGKPIPSGVRRRLGEAMVESGGRFPAVAKKAEDSLRKLGYPIKRKGLFGLGREVDTSEAP
ncbi:MULTISPECIES: hypothetical protein [unclassified Microbacterium]|uniref:hypothetical protein n=1 Tax=unclassified Microbacterium TaxID=2609290 RepID=UPI00301B202F